MKNLIIILFLLFTNYAFAQVVSSDTRMVSGDIQIWGGGFTTFGGEYEQGLFDNVTGKGSIDIYPNSYYTGIITRVAGSYYFNDLLKINNDQIMVYAGLGLAKGFSLSALYTYGGYAVAVPVHAGAKYFFNDKIGANAEILVGRKYTSSAAFKFGVTFKWEK